MTLRRTLHPQFYVPCAFRMLHIQELLSLLNTCIIAEKEAMARQGTPQQPRAKPWLTRPDSGGSRGSQLLSSADLVSWIQSISRFINGVPGLCWGEQFYLLLCQLQNTLPSWLAASTYWSASFPPCGLNRSRPRGCWLRTTPQFSIPSDITLVIRNRPWSLAGCLHSGNWQRPQTRTFCFPENQLFISPLSPCYDLDPSLCNRLIRNMMTKWTLPRVNF